MAGYRSSVIQRLHPIAGSIPLSLLLKATGQKLILPVYHLVSDMEVPHIRHLYQPKDTMAFVRDLEFLSKNFQPLDFNDLLELITSERTLSRPAFFLTFDDGLREFYTVIAPILEDRGIKAMNFLNPDFIDNKDLFYRYKISVIIENLKNRASQIMPLISTKLGKTTKRNSSVITHLLQLKYQDMPVIDEIATILEVDFQAYLKERQPYLNTEEINDLIRRGFTFGAHSMDHPMYSDLDLSTQIRQTLDSIDAVVHKFGINYRVFAFPFTDYKVSRNFFDHLYGSEKQPDLTFGSAGLKEDIYRQHLQRIPMEMGDLSATAIIHTELLYYYLKGFAGKNRIIRS